MLFKKTHLALLVGFTGLAGCANTFEIDNETRYGDLSPGREAKMQAARGTTYVREIKTEDLALKRPIFRTGQGLVLRTVLQEALPGYAIIPSGNVNLNDTIDVASEGMTLKDFVEYVEGTKDLSIRLDGKRAYVTDFETKQWNLAAFATTRSLDNIITSKQSRGAKAGDDESKEDAQTTGSSIGTSISEDEWRTIMEGARRIIGAPKPDESARRGANGLPNGPATAPGGGLVMPDGTIATGLNFGPNIEQVAPTLSDAKPAFIEGIRSVGVVTAGGKPGQMRILDLYLKKAVSDATKIVNVQVQAYDVVLKDGKQKGINWDALKLGSISGNLFNVGLSNTSQVLTGGGFWNFTGTYDGDRGNGKSFLSLLETFGRVELQDQPNLTVRNGVPAQIYAGEELTYIVDVEQSQNERGVATVTPKLGRLKVGVTLAVTVRVLDDERLLVDVTPVISNLSSYDTIAIGDFSFDTPRVALKEFSTQLICNSGESVHLGGLITERMEKAMERLPWQNIVTKAVVNPLFSNINNQLERRELVLVVTPTVVEGTR
ncbi:pilus assembly protein [Pseudomonas syringae]|uniref:type II secretion system protein GspD n=1 Tax=Pseudomonas syringae TaxID=317 RepID=UPI001F395BD4|nr:type II and III secretion system protein [Pseudomonas syringae]MCF5382109.1 pilus assembly protein [Pseudomonas syringae]MCF5422938.1 pilus assembly protein [Pseudomonas syringae]MCF5455474.1 pilus assembly protein [Pseudomonas syringae]MCF5460193.1 pilus assembly protein [Pseudomonas syringae]